MHIKWILLYSCINYWLQKFCSTQYHLVQTDILHTYCILITYVMNQPTVYSQTSKSMNAVWSSSLSFPTMTSLILCCFAFLLFLNSICEQGKTNLDTLYPFSLLFLPQLLHSLVTINYHGTYSVVRISPVFACWTCFLLYFFVYVFANADLVSPDCSIEEWLLSEKAFSGHFCLVVT